MTQLVVGSHLDAVEVRALLAAVFEDFTEPDWAHCLGGVHAQLRDDRGLVGHAALVPRTLWCGDRQLRAGYVEGLAVRADARRRGHGSALMTALEERSASYDVLALSATDGAVPFYRTRGWRRWRGPTSVRTPSGAVRTPDDDGSVFVLPSGVDLDLDLELTCDWRSGDVW